MQQWAVNIFYFIAILPNMFPVRLHPSSGAQETVVTARGIVVGDSCRFKFKFLTVYAFYYLHLIRINTIPVAVNTVACTPDDGCKRTQNMLSKTAVK
jgi:hypothetical protein